MHFKNYPEHHQRWRAGEPEPEGPGEWACPHATAAHSPERERYGLVIAPLPLPFGIKSKSS